MRRWAYRVERIVMRDLPARLEALDDDGWEPFSVSWGAQCDVLLRRRLSGMELLDRLDFSPGEPDDPDV